jgi:hypothetical protein
MAAEDKTTLGIALPTTGFRRYMFFNRFAVERTPGFVHIQLGFVNKANVLLDSYSSVISELELGALRGSTMDYLGRQGALLEAPPLWQPQGAMPAEVSNHILMAHHGSIAETIFFVVPFWSALEEAKRVAALRETKKPAEGGVVAEPLALMRSPVAAQQHLIRLLFSTDEPLLTNE